MKKILLLIITLITALVSSQNIAHYNAPKKGKYTAYITKNKDTIRVNDTLHIGMPRADKYTFITQGNLQAGAIITGTSPVISKIKTFGTKTRGFKTYLGFKGYGLTVWVDYENALLAQEIIKN